VTEKNHGGAHKNHDTILARSVLQKITAALPTPFRSPINPYVVLTLHQLGLDLEDETIVAKYITNFSSTGCTSLYIHIAGSVHQ
jgi:hypothetical protein